MKEIAKCPDCGFSIYEGHVSHACEMHADGSWRYVSDRVETDYGFYSSTRMQSEPIQYGLSDDAPSWDDAR